MQFLLRGLLPVHLLDLLHWAHSGVHHRKSLLVLVVEAY
jgi:hypothetical protein